MKPVTLTAADRRTKLIKHFFNESEIKKATSYQLSKAKMIGLINLKAEVVDAYQLFKQNGWDKKSPFEIGLPVKGQFMVVLHYKNSKSPFNKYYSR